MKKFIRFLLKKGFKIYRWSIYIVKDPKEIHYFMHCDSVIKMIGYFLIQFCKYGPPPSPWRIYVNFNETHQSFQLTEDHFDSDNENISKKLVSDIKEIDYNYLNINSSMPLFYNAKTKKQIPLTRNLNNLFKKVNKTSIRKETETFFSVLDRIYNQK